MLSPARHGPAAARRRCPARCTSAGRWPATACCRCPSASRWPGRRWPCASLDPADPALDGTALGDWLAARGQSERARRLLWDLFIVSALNIAGDDASLPLSATVIKMALLGARDAADIGVATVPLGDLHGRAAATLLGRLGAAGAARRQGGRHGAAAPAAGSGSACSDAAAAGGRRRADG